MFHSGNLIVSKATPLTQSAQGSGNCACKNLYEQLHVHCLWESIKLLRVCAIESNYSEVKLLCLCAVASFRSSDVKSGTVPSELGI